VHTVSSPALCPRWTAGSLLEQLFFYNFPFTLPSRVFPSVKMRLKRLNQPLSPYQPRSVEVRLKKFQPRFNRFNRMSTEPGNFWRSSLMVRRMHERTSGLHKLMSIVHRLCHSEWAWSLRACLLALCKSRPRLVRGTRSKKITIC